MEISLSLDELHDLVHSQQQLIESKEQMVFDVEAHLEQLRYKRFHESLHRIVNFTNQYDRMSDENMQLTVQKRENARLGKFLSEQRANFSQKECRLLEAMAKVEALNKRLSDIAAKQPSPEPLEIKSKSGESSKIIREFWTDQDRTDQDRNRNDNNSQAANSPNTINNTDPNSTDNAASIHEPINNHVVIVRVPSPESKVEKEQNKTEDATIFGNPMHRSNPCHRIFESLRLEDNSPVPHGRHAAKDGSPMPNMDNVGKFDHDLNGQLDNIVEEHTPSSPDSYGSELGGQTYDIQKGQIGTSDSDDPIKPVPDVPLPDVPSSSSILKKRTGDAADSSVDKSIRRVKFDALALLLDASLEGEIELVHKTACQVDDPSESNSEGITALHNAICARHEAVARLLVGMGADVNVADEDRWTALHCAASCNNAAMAKLLIEAGASVYTRTSRDLDTARQKCDRDEEGFAECHWYLADVEQKMGKDSGGLVHALFDYEAEKEDEISFKSGEVFKVLQRNDTSFHKEKSADQRLGDMMDSDSDSDDDEGVVDEWWLVQRLNDKDDLNKEGLAPRTFFGLYPRRPLLSRVVRGALDIGAYSASSGPVEGGGETQSVAIVPSASSDEVGVLPKDIVCDGLPGVLEKRNSLTVGLSSENLAIGENEDLKNNMESETLEEAINTPIEAQSSH